MQSKISIQQIMEEATKHEQIASLYRRVAESLRGLNPNVELLISGDQSVPPQLGPALMNIQSSIDSRAAVQNKLEALIDVLKSSGKPMNKYQIEKEMKLRGYEITTETLTSYLSRNKDKFFKNTSRGVWKYIGVPHFNE